MMMYQRSLSEGTKGVRQNTTSHDRVKSGHSKEKCVAARRSSMSDLKKPTRCGSDNIDDKKMIFKRRLSDGALAARENASPNEQENAVDVTEKRALRRRSSKVETKESGRDGPGNLDDGNGIVKNTNTVGVATFRRKSTRGKFGEDIKPRLEHPGRKFLSHKTDNPKNTLTRQRKESKGKTEAKPKKKNSPRVSTKTAEEIASNSNGKTKEETKEGKKKGTGNLEKIPTVMPPPAPAPVDGKNSAATHPSTPSPVDGKNKVAKNSIMKRLIRQPSTRRNDLPPPPALVPVNGKISTVTPPSTPPPVDGKNKVAKNSIMKRLIRQPSTRRYDLPFNPCNGMCLAHPTEQIAIKNPTGGWKMVQDQCPQCFS